MHANIKFRFASVTYIVDMYYDSLQIDDSSSVS